jgi:hypothetical protein
MTLIRPNYQGSVSSHTRNNKKYNTIYILSIIIIIIIIIMELKSRWLCWDQHIDRMETEKEFIQNLEEKFMENPRNLCFLRQRRQMLWSCVDIT